MHRKKSKRWMKLFSTSGIIALIFGGLIIQSVRAISTNPLPVCVGASCSVTFESTGDYFAWSPPAGARNISFDLMGAQGGRTGGLGGRLTGNIPTTPSTLFIYVGGAGAAGSNANGGFNGGGKAGSGRGDEGSGGGATDIRTSTALGDRIAVAAGGGGTGGFFGGTGGAAGGLSGSAGISGQGQGGSGASQSAGGNGGFPNGGSWGETGQSGQGGTGGTSSLAGGGGGGGGYFGGGGGGADLDGCCSNAGGGGGGSSWSHPTQVSSATHTAAFRSGAGQAIISYVMPPSVISFTPATVNTNLTSLSFSISFNETVSGLAAADFTTTGSTASCTSLSVTGSGSSYTLQATGCNAGTYKLSIGANSVTGAITGPAAALSAADVVIDQTVPTVLLTAPLSPSTSSILRYDLVFSESVSGLATADFSVVGDSCSVSQLTGTGLSYSVQVSNCTDTALVQLALKANAVSDLAGNNSPLTQTQFANVQLDRVAPIGVWSPGETSGFISPSFELVFPEVITGLTTSDFTNIGSATGCALLLTENQVGTNYTIATSSCGNGTVQISMASSAFADSLGNLGPVSASISRVVNKIAQPAPIQTQAPAPEPSPTPTQAPVPTPVPSASPTQAPAPAPQESAEPVPTGGASNSGSLPPPTFAEAENLAGALVIPKSFSFSAPLELQTNQPSVQNKPTVESKSEAEIGPEEITNATPSIQSAGILDQLWIWLAWLLIGVGTIGVLIGGLRLLQGVRTKNLVRKLA